MLFLLLGDLPWRLQIKYESPIRAMERIHSEKQDFLETFPVRYASDVFLDLVQVARAPGKTLMKAVGVQRQAFHALISASGMKNTDPLDWSATPAAAITNSQYSCNNAILCDDETSEGRSDTDDSERFSSSYTAMDYEMWDNVRGGRDKTLTFPPEEAQLLDGNIPELGEIGEIDIYAGC
jgi:hypothetical protein